MSTLINSVVLTNFDKAQFAGPITNKDAIALIKEYKDCEGWGDKRTKSVWFSKSELLAMIDEIPLEADGGDGLRIYFAKYPSSLPSAPPPTGYENRNTLVFVPTVKGPGGSHTNVIPVEAYILGQPIPGEPPIPGRPPGGSPSNHGQLCPPNC